MILDAQNLLSDAQAFSSSGASSNIIDLGATRDIGKGEPMAVVITVDQAADYTTGDETYQFDIQVDDNSNFSSPTSIVSRSIAANSLTQGSIHVLPVPPDKSVERYLRLYATLGGTTPSVTITAALVPMSSVQNDGVYPDGITIS